MIHADISADLLRTIFSPRTPLHDGAVIETIDDTSNQRGFRPNHGQVYALIPGQIEQSLDVICFDRNIPDACFARCARIAGRNDDFCYSRGTRQRPGQRMFSAAATHYEYFHLLHSAGARFATGSQVG